MNYNYTHHVVILPYKTIYKLPIDYNGCVLLDC